MRQQVKERSLTAFTRSNSADRTDGTAGQGIPMTQREAVIVAGARTAVATSFKGSLVDVDALTLGTKALAEAVTRSGIPAEDFDDVIMADHNKELLAASARAKARLPEKKKLFSGQIPDLERLLVKAPFKSVDGRGEWMWVEVTAWKGKQITGVTRLKRGDQVQFGQTVAEVGK